METVENEIADFNFEKFQAIRSRSLGRLIWRLKRHIHLHVEPMLIAKGHADFKLSSLAFIANIDEHGTTNNELAKKACVSKQAMSKVVKELEEHRYVYTRPNEADARSSVIFLDERGKQLFVDLNEAMTDVRTRFDKAIGAKKCRQMIDTMYDLLAVLDTEEERQKG